MNRLGGRTPMSLAMLVIFGVIVGTMASPAHAQEPSGREVAAALKRKDIPPAPRLSDGHPDLGNGAGAWAAPAIDNMGGGKTPREGGGGGGGAQPEKVVEVPMLPWAKALVDKRASRDDIQDPEAYGLVPGHPRSS